MQISAHRLQFFAPATAAAKLKNNGHDARPRQIGSVKVSVLVPVFNEEDTVAQILNHLTRLKFITQIVVINDASTDKSLAAIRSVRSSKITLIDQPFNQGKTAAICAGLQIISGDIVLIQDADMEYDPDEIESLIDPILQGRADVVYGSRFLVKKAARVLYFYHYLANKFLTFLCNLLTNLNMTDIETCYKAFRAELVKGLPLTSKGFGMEVELTAYIARCNVRIYEVPISYYGRTYHEGKKIGIKDGIAAIYYILYYNLTGRFNRIWKTRIQNMQEKIP
ncbi:MAG: glycosyltransferase family 2 protein [Spirochaetales bacterium]|nr:glycosyltransferase family 2 protein [Spirochaetales bacterium]